MTGASGVAEPSEVCAFKIDEFYHLEGCALPRARCPGPEGARGAAPAARTALPPGPETLLQPLSSLFLYFFFIFVFFIFFFLH